MLFDKDEDYQNKIKEISIWTYLARVLPFVALFIITAAHFFDYENTYHIIIVSILGTFFTVAVTWWWWAIITIGKIFLALDRSSKSFNKIESEINEFKKNMHRDR